jgi:hypothetical protein
MSLAMTLVAALIVSPVGGGSTPPPPDRMWRNAHLFDMQPERRESSAAMKTLFASYFALQAADVYSTAAAQRSGAREINPVMDGNLGQVLAVKAVTGLTTYYAVNKMAKTNRKAAVVALAVLNAVTAAVVVHNLNTKGVRAWI